MQCVRIDRRPRGGFTLIEMLVVIAIIGVLMAILVPVVMGAMRRARVGAISVEIADMARALDAYKAFAGNDFPPDFTNNQAVVNHMAKAFPRNARNVVNWYSNDPSNWTANTSSGLDAGEGPNLDPSEALVFWLSMLSTNPRDPLGGADLNYTGERKVFFAFKTERLFDFDGDGWMSYVPENAVDRPYIYFDGRLIGGEYAYGAAVWPKQSTPQPAPVLSGEVVRPYRSNTLITIRDGGRTKPMDYNPSTKTPANPLNGTEWIKPGQLQIICAGLDNEYGADFASGTSVVFKQYPAPNYTLVGPEEDNLTDFSDGKMMVDAVP